MVLRINCGLDIFRDKRAVQELKSCISMARNDKQDKRLIEAHRLHAGLYYRVSKKLGIDASFFSRVALEKRTPSVRSAMLEELYAIQRRLNG